MRATHCPVRTVLSFIAASALGACAATSDPTIGSLTINLTGSASTGTVYRLRDATITVDGPDPTVFNTEDDPTRTSLSADVQAADYTATVQPGWRLERIDGDLATTVTATLTSDNPAHFTVAPQQRTIVPLQFRADGQQVDMTQGYDITLVVDEGIPSPGTGYQAIDAPSTRSRLVYDAARQAIYAVNRLDQQIERFVLSSGQWAAADPVVVPLLTDVTLTPDGQTLVVLDHNAVSDVALASGFTLIQRASNPDPFCGGFFDKAAAGSNGKVFIVFGLAGCSGFSSSYTYDMASHALTRITSLFNGTVAGSADGTRIYAGSNGISPPGGLIIYNPQSNSVSTSSIDVNLDAISVSGDASRVIVENTQLYSRSLTLLGNVPPGGVALASRDSSKAFVYRDDPPGPRLTIYDLNGALQAGALFPLLRTIRLPDSPNVTNGDTSPIAMTSNADDSFVFLSGNRRMLVVPVQ
jgi:hypothetical protein